tara:strand:- start:1026 stop:1268 length:243 start_codon:yes stop_codon:yes gene_type:complete
MRGCAEYCTKTDTDCPCKECRLWINYPDDLNCTLIAIDKEKCMTLREAADRMGVSFVRVKQIQDQALEKVKRMLKKQKSY